MVLIARSDVADLVEKSNEYPGFSLKKVLAKADKKN